MTYRLSKLEIAGSLADLGVILPIAVGMIMVNQLSPQGVFLSVGLFYIASGIYFGTTTPVQPMKVMGSYAITMGLASSEVHAASLTVGVTLFLIGLSGSMKRIIRIIPKPVIRGIQLSTGILLMAQSVRFVLGEAPLQQLRHSAEPFLSVTKLGPVPINWLLGLAAMGLTMALLTSKRFPAGLVVIGFGILSGLLLGAATDGIALAPQLPSLMPEGMPSLDMLVAVFIALTLPQLPMTLGNAVIANADLAKEYFGDDARRTTPKALCLSMGLANLGSFLLGGIPMCHGAGGLAAHYRFGARTAGSNMFIGGLFVITALLLGDTILDAVRLIPLSVLGVLLFFAGSQLALTILDMKTRQDLFICVTVLGITLASNLAVGFILGAALAALMRSGRFTP
ncbi:putative sulfate/molybdate transporter [Desulfovibrio ferrophilus]|uniref:Sulfate transporter n=1 Tax=Desulfovibrio ferrophilus TaxID=241368 RepID=A0A2Z6AVW1_9BACT|nr:putative sulfate/molybdate transporter [Desulfovibrio ferrophilus]BBD07377.1 sulfate transporter [Desulfovibrio ferrophilus]